MDLNFSLYYLTLFYLFIIFPELWVQTPADPGRWEPFGVFFRELFVTVIEDLQARAQSEPICLSRM